MQKFSLIVKDNDDICVEESFKVKFLEHRSLYLRSISSPAIRHKEREERNKFAHIIAQ